MKRIWEDKDGAIITSEIILILSILICGLVVGFVTIRDALVSELGDISAALGSLNQSYTYQGLTGHSAACSGSQYTDSVDHCDIEDSGFFSACIQLAPPSPESMNEYRSRIVSSQENFNGTFNQNNLNRYQNDNREIR